MGHNVEWNKADRDTRSKRENIDEDKMLNMKKVNWK
jgi:hypothetical protein